MSRTTCLKGIKRICNPFDVVRLCCCNDQQQRKLVGIYQRVALDALFPSVRVFWVFDSGDLVMQPFIENQEQSMLPRCSQAGKPFNLTRSKMPAPRHF
ncbi:hypothetical protein A9798_07125 [Edwardsiella hoshinae]|uniref:Uncharacterized protein n=1 Tax=Edwardsiella hoshinae TaxID=93378 RepID=A0ABN4T0F6_9GAMM|nr:hypothetical protein A9798_07125 [Edwardsiella hoshinae]